MTIQIYIEIPRITCRTCNRSLDPATGGYMRTGLWERPQSLILDLPEGASRDPNGPPYHVRGQKQEKLIQVAENCFGWVRIKVPEYQDYYEMLCPECTQVVRRALFVREAPRHV